MRSGLLVLFAVLILNILPAKAATVTCEVKSVQGRTMILENCDEKRAKGFEPGSKVKIKLQQEPGK